MRHFTTLFLLTLMYHSATFASEPQYLLDFQPAAEIGAEATASQGPDGELAIEVDGGTGPKTFTLIICERPKIQTPHYVVRGRVKYSGVEGDGYIELLNDFGPDGTYFSRAIADFDPMRKLHGESDWRQFELPFHSKPGVMPQRLILNIVLPGAGKVTTTQPTLSDLDLGTTGSEQKAIVPPAQPGDGRPQTTNEWWSPRQAGLVGGLGGSLLGILGGLLGTLMAWSQTRGLVRRVYPFVLAACYGILVIGIFAVCLKQPYHVFFPTLMIGVIGASVLQLNYFNVYQTVQDDELRKMTALDVN